VSAKPAGSDAEQGRDPEADYYQGVEEFFVSRRGDPLFLSNADWLLVKGWRTQGIPLRVVLRGIADALDAHAHSWSRERKVTSLAYCRNEVEAARERWERALSLGAEVGADPGGFLEELARALAEAPGLGPRAGALARELSREIRERARGPLAVRELEGWLLSREAKLLEVLREELAEEGVARAEAEVEAALAPYRERLPALVLDQVRRESMARKLLEAHGLPRLSLFVL